MTPEDDMPLPVNQAAPIPFRLGVAVDPSQVTVRGFGPGGGPFGDPGPGGERITVMDAGVYQYLTPQGELAYPGLYLYLFDAPGGSDAVRFEVG